MEALWTAAAEPLQAAGLTVYRAMGPGAAARIRAAQVALQLRRCALEGRDIVLKSPGTQIRSYCYAADTT